MSQTNEVELEIGKESKRKISDLVFGTNFKRFNPDDLGLKDGENDSVEPNSEQIKDESIDWETREELMWSESWSGINFKRFKPEDLGLSDEENENTEQSYGCIKMEDTDVKPAIKKLTGMKGGYLPLAHNLGTDYSLEECSQLSTVKTKVEDASDGVTNNSWQDVKSLPTGWKYRETVRGGQKLFYILSPSAKIFPCRRLALKHMVDYRYREDEVESMRNMLIFEGWQDHPMLPNGWRWREDKMLKNSMEYMAKDGTFFKSYRQAEEFVKSSDEKLRKLKQFVGSKNVGVKIKQEKIKREITGNEDSKSQEDALKFGLLFDKSTTRRSDNNDWIHMECLPPHWKMRKGLNSKYFYLSPSGQQFVGGRLALQYMIENQHNEEEIEAMRNTLCKTGWERSEYLPQGWLISQCKSFSQKGSLKVITKEGKVLESNTAIRWYMSIHINYGQEDLIKLDTLFKDKSNTRRLKQLDWDDNKTLPAGWREKISPSGKKFFLSPDGINFAGRRLAYQHMVNNNYPAEEIDFMRKSMEEDGWRTSQFLPPNWLVKQIHRLKGGSDVSILSSEGDFMQSYISTMKFMEHSTKYGREDIRKVNELIKDTTKEWRKTNIDETFNDVRLPIGWKSRQCGSHYFVVSPEGHQFNNKRKALQEMVRRNLPESDLQLMRDAMEEDGWIRSDYLPVNWRCKLIGEKKTTYNFLTADGDMLKGSEAARNLVFRSDKFSQEEREGLRIFIDIQSVMIRSKSYDWNENDESIPRGWKSRMGGSKQFFLSPDGQQFPCRRACLQYMIKDDFEEEEIEEMRMLTVKWEGFEKSEDLPSGWIQRQRPSNHHNVQILSSEGNLYQSYITAMEFMEKSENYNKTDIDKLNVLIEKNANKRRQFQEDLEEDDTVPAGWRIKVSKSKTEKIFLISPWGAQFSSRRLALKAMMEKNLPDEEIEDMRRRLIFEDWETSPGLPAKWYYKSKDGDGKGGCIYVSHLGDRIESTKAAIEYIVKNDPNNKIDIDKLNLLIQRPLKSDSMTKAILSKRIKKEAISASSSLMEPMNSDWEEDHSLPLGWKSKKMYRHGVGEVEIFLTSTQRIITSRELAIEHMVDEKFDKADIERMKGGLFRLGWQVDPNLPIGVLIKGEEFYTPDNQRIEGMVAFLEYLLDQDCYDFSVTGYIARKINWTKLKSDRRVKLQRLMNEQMKKFKIE